MYLKEKNAALKKEVINSTLERNEAVFREQLDLNQLIIQLKSTPYMMKFSSKSDVSLVPIA